MTINWLWESSAHWNRQNIVKLSKERHHFENLCTGKVWSAVWNRGAAHRRHAGEIRLHLPSQGAEISCAASRWLALPLPGEPAGHPMVCSLCLSVFKQPPYANAFPLSLSLSLFHPLTLLVYLLIPHNPSATLCCNFFIMCFVSNLHQGCFSPPDSLLLDQYSLACLRAGLW